MNLELAGKVFIVTGGTDGLGLATAKSLIAEGANVLVSGRSEGKYASRWQPSCCPRSPPTSRGRRSRSTVGS